jgi:hypothetical protein
MKDIEGNNARNETDQDREQNKPPVVLTGKTVKNSEHETARRWILPTISLFHVPFC